MILLDIPEPKNCSDCIFCDYEQGYCYLSTKDGTWETTENVSEYAEYGDRHFYEKYVDSGNDSYDPSKAKPDWCPASKQLDKIYVITTGEYSDYSVRAATISKEKAEKLRKFHSYGWCNGEARIEEFDIDEPHENLDDLIPVYRVLIERDGRCYSYQATWIHKITGKLIEDSSYKESDLGSELNTDPESYIGNYLLFHWCGPAKDKEHALKIAQDERAKAYERYLMDHGEEHEKKLKIAQFIEHFNLYGGGMPK